MKIRILPISALVMALAVVAMALVEAVNRTLSEGAADFVWNWGLAETSIAVNFAIVGGVLASRRPRNPIGWLLLLQAWQAVAGLVGVEAVIAVPWSGVLAAIVLLFPHGRPMSRAWGGVLWVVAAVCVAIIVGDRAGIRLQNGPVWDALEPVLLVSLGAAVVSVVLRYRRGTGTERLQLRAFASASVIALVAFVVSVPLGILPIVNAIAIPSIAWGLAVAVLRYRLYDLDRLISRTVSYAVLSAVLVGVYAGVVLGLQTIFRPSGTSDLAVAIATLTAAGLFTPVRRRLQRVVDRRFNRARYDAATIVAAFSGDLRDELEPDVLISGMEQVVIRTVQPTFVKGWTVPRAR